MTISDMFGQSAALAFLGMAVVFSFLVLLIICVTLVGRIIHLLGLDKEAPKVAVATAQTGGSPQGPVVAAITAAVKKYRGE